MAKRLRRAHQRLAGTCECGLVGGNSSRSNSEQSNVGKRGQIGDGIVRLDPHALLAGILEPSVITLDLTAHGVDFLRRDAGAVNGKPVIIGNGDIFGAAAVFLAVEKAFMGTWAGRIVHSVFERTAIFLPEPAASTVLSRLMHDKPGLAENGTV